MKAKIAPRITLSGRTKLETVIPLSTPYLVFLDPSDICNAKCKWCPTGSGEARKYKKPQLMDFDLYRKIIDDLCDMPEPIKTLRLYKDGEPLLNDAITEMIQYASDTHRFGQIDLTTNGILLTPQMSDGLIDAGLNKIFISVPQNYGQGYLNQVSYFYHYSRGRCIVFCKMIKDGASEIKIKDFLNDFGKVSHEISIEYLSLCWPNFNIGDANKEVGIYGQPIKEVQVCPYIFYSLAINSNGTVSLCFLDWKHDMIIGDLKKESFKDIWNGYRLKRCRIEILQHRKSIESCSDCGQLAYGQPDDLDQYTEDILRRIQ